MADDFPICTSSLELLSFALVIHLHWDIPHTLNANTAKLEFLVFLLGIASPSHIKSQGILSTTFSPLPSHSMKNTEYIGLKEGRKGKRRT